MTERTTAPLTQKAETAAARTHWREKLGHPAVLCLFLAVTSLMVFLPVGRYGYVNYDDSDYVTANPHVQSGLRWENVIWAFKSGHASNWHPLTWISHMLDIQLFGDKPGAEHLVSVGLHIANALLLFLLLQRMTGARWRSFMVAGLFSLHPLHVESVAWISERKDVLSGFFFLLTVGAYVRYAECRTPTTNHASRFTFHVSRFTPTCVWYLLALLCCALGLMSKPMLVTLPFVLLLLDYWPLGSVERGVCCVALTSPFFILPSGQ